MASAVIVATENGKCVGTKIVSYTISARDINEVEASVSLDPNNNPIVKLTFGETVLTQNTDYTMSIVRDDANKKLTVTIVGIGNFEGRRVIVLNNVKPIKTAFNPVHLAWIIPVALIVAGGAGFGGYMMFKKFKGKKKTNGLAEDITNEE